MQERYETFTVLINRISRNVKKIKNREMADYNLKSAHISCLYYIYRSDGLTSSQLCDKCEEDKATVSRALCYLEENGYTRCLSDTAKRYNSVMELTDKGKEAAEKIALRIDKVLDKINGELTEEERLAFYKSLTIISEGLDAIAAL